MYSHLAVLNPLYGGVGPYGGGVGFQPEYSKDWKRPYLGYFLYNRAYR